MFPVLQIGPFALQTPGLIIILGIWIGLTLAERFSPVFKENANQYYNLAFTLIITGVIGARLTYAIHYREIFIRNPLNIFSLNPGLLDPLGGIGIALVAGIIYIDRRNLSLWQTLDAFTLVFGVMVVAVALSQLASGDAYGLETRLPWSIELWGKERHPTQIYAILAGLIILYLIWPRKGRDTSQTRRVGNTIWTFVAMSSGARLFLEAFRGDNDLLVGNIRGSQVIAWLILAVSLLALYKIESHKILEDENHEKKRI